MVYETEWKEEMEPDDSSPLIEIPISQQPFVWANSESGKADWPVRELEFTMHLPKYQPAGAAGMDICAANVEVITLEPGERTLVPTGFSLAIPIGYEGQIRPRSGLANSYGVTVLNAPGTIDSDYRGEVQVLLINHGPEPFEIKSGMRIAQLDIAPVMQAVLNEVKTLPDTDRGEGAFGHTGMSVDDYQEQYN